MLSASLYLIGTLILSSPTPFFSSALEDNYSASRQKKLKSSPCNHVEGTKKRLQTSLSDKASSVLPNITPAFPIVLYPNPFFLFFHYHLLSSLPAAPSLFFFKQFFNAPISTRTWQVCSMSTLHFLLYSNYIQHFIFIAIQYIHKVELWRNNLTYTKFLWGKNPTKPTQLQ